MAKSRNHKVTPLILAVGTVLIASGTSLRLNAGERPSLRTTSQSSRSFTAKGSDTFGSQRVLGGAFVEPITKAVRKGLWIEGRREENRQLLVDHGDATALLYPTFSPDGTSVVFAAQHSDIYELHQYNTRTYLLETIESSAKPYSAKAVRLFANHLPPVATALTETISPLPINSSSGGFPEADDFETGEILAPDVLEIPT